jgi:hypothetical protein
MSALQQRRNFIFHKIIYQRANRTADENLRYTETWNTWLLRIQGSLYVLLLAFLLVSGIGSMFSEYLANKWNNAGLVAIFAVTYSLHTFTSWMHRICLQHLRRLQEQPTTEKTEEAKKLNKELRQHLYGRSWIPIILLIPLVLVGLFQVLLENLTIWPYLGPVYAIGVIALAWERYRAVRAVRDNVGSFERILKIDLSKTHSV